MSWSILSITCLLLIGGTPFTTGPGQSSGAISGLVVSDEDQPKPVRRAIVTVSGTPLASSRTALTDDDGRFVFDGLPAGSYTVTAARATFVTSAYGARRPGRPGRQVPVTLGESATNLVIRLWRGGVVSGIARTPGGHPVEGVTVRAIPRDPYASAYPSLTNNPTVTNDRGEFRIFGLEPGDYLVAIQPPAAYSKASVALRDDDVDRMLQELGGGEPSPSAAAPSRPPRHVQYAPVYWPGTVDAGAAQSVAVTAGSETGGLDLALILAPTALVAGTVLGPTGTPTPGVSVRLRSAAAADGLALPSTIFSATTQADGTFAIQGVPAGTYDVIASTGGEGSGDASRRTLWATDRVRVASDRHEIFLSLGFGLTVQGRVLISDADRSVQLPEGISLALLPSTVTAVGPNNSLAGTVGGAAVRPDGTFQVTNLRPDLDYRLFLNGLGADRWPETALIGSVDLFDGPVRLTAALTAEPLVVTFSASRTELYGTLTGHDALGPVFVVVFPVDSAIRRSERRTRATQPDAAGQYRFEGLPPGDYFVGAIADVDPGAWRSPAFLEQLSQVAAKITLGRAERRRLDIRTR